MDEELTIRFALAQAVKDRNDEGIKTLAAFIHLGVALDAEFFHDEQDVDDDTDSEPVECVIANTDTEDWELEKIDGEWQIVGHGQAIGPWGNNYGMDA